MVVLVAEVARASLRELILALDLSINACALKLFTLRCYENSPSINWFSRGRSAFWYDGHVCPVLRRHEVTRRCRASRRGCFWRSVGCGRCFHYCFCAIGGRRGGGPGLDEWGGG